MIYLDSAAVVTLVRQEACSANRDRQGFVLGEGFAFLIGERS